LASLAVVAATFLSSCSTTPEVVRVLDGSVPAWNDETVLDLGDLPEAESVADVAMPAPSNLVGEWLASESSRVDALLEAAAFLWSDGAEACADVAALLDTIGTPETLLEDFAAAPDQPTADVLVGLLSATGTALVVCDDSDAFDRRRKELAWAWAIAARRTEQIRANP
jgi:hypothetical protein